MRRCLPASLLLTILVACSCNAGTEYMPDAVGAPDEVLVVMPKGHWEGQPGAVVRSILEQPLEGMPQREPRFRVAQTTPENFGAMLSAHHSVLLAAIGQSDSVPLRQLRDRSARGQLTIQLTAPDPVSWNARMQQDGEEGASAFEVHHRTRIGARLVKERDKALVSSLRASHGISLDIPGGYHVVKQTAGVTLLERDRLITSSGLEHNVIEGVLVHEHPYTSDSTFNVPFLVDLRDSVTRQHVNGPDPGSYMIVQRRFEDLDLMPTGRIASLGGRFAYLMHGLYGMQGAKMGGPFVSLCTVDEARGRLVIVDGFVYAPQFDKRPYVRELESLLFSLRIDTVPSP